MEFRKIIQRRIRRRTGGVDLAGDVNAVIAANVGGSKSHTHVSTRQTSTVRQGGVDERRSESKPD